MISNAPRLSARGVLFLGVCVQRILERGGRRGGCGCSWRRQHGTRRAQNNPSHKLIDILLVKMNLNDDEEEGNAAELNFGKEFATAECLTNDELCVLLQEEKGRDRVGGRPTSEVFEQTLSYITTVVPVADSDKLGAVSKELREGIANMDLYTTQGGGPQRLAVFEVALISNLIPQDCTAEEAVAWIPSLKRFDPDQVELVLNKVSTAKSRAV